MLPVKHQPQYYLFNKSLFKYFPIPASKVAEVSLGAGLVDFQAKLFQSFPPFAQKPRSQGPLEGAPQDRKGRIRLFY